MLAGDVPQHQAVDAGKPYEQLQQAGMQTARLEEIVRGSLREAVEHLARGQVREAIDLMHRQAASTRSATLSERMRMIANEHAGHPAGCTRRSTASEDRRYTTYVFLVGVLPTEIRATLNSHGSSCGASD